MIAYKSRYAAEVWFGGRQAAEIWLGDKLVWSGKRVPLRVLVDLGLVSRAQLAAALGKAGVSEPEMHLIASALALGEPGLSGSAQSEALAADGLACRQAGQDSTAVLRLEAAQADGGAALPGVLVWQGVARLDPDAMPGSAAGRSAAKAARLEEKAADAEFGAWKGAEKSARLDKPFVLPQAGQGGNAQAEKRLDAESAAGAFGAGHKAERTERLDGLLADGRAGAERKAEISRALEVLYGAGAFGAGRSAEKTGQIERIAAGAAFGHGFAARKNWQMLGFSAAVKSCAGWLLEKAAEVLRSGADGAFGTGKQAEKTGRLDAWRASAKYGTGRKSRKQAVLALAEGTLAGLAGAKSAAGAVLEKSAAKVQRSGQIFAKVQREGLNLAGKAKIRTEKQMQALAKLAARARAGLLGALGRKARIQNEAGMRAQGLAVKSGGGLLYSDVRTKPVALALPVAILPKRLQGAAKAGASALAWLEKTDGDHLAAAGKMVGAAARADSVQGSALCGKQKTGSVLAAAKKAGVAAAASVRHTEGVYAVLSVEHASWALPVLENGWLKLAQVKTAEALNGWLVLDAVQGWKLPTVQDGWAQIVQVQDAKTENGWLVLDEAQETSWELPAVQDGWLAVSQAKESGTENGYLELR